MKGEIRIEGIEYCGGWHDFRGDEPMGFYRQGDVAFIPSSKARSKKKSIPSGIVAQGEATGHAHRLQLADGVSLFEDGQYLWIEVGDEAQGFVAHEEHKTIVLPPGKYDITIQREYSPKEIRNVQD